MKQTLKITLLVLFLCIITVSADAATSKLEIDRVEITSDEKMLLRSSGNSGKIKVDPDQELTIQVRLENNYADETENDIDDVRVFAVIEGIDEGKDVLDESEQVRVRADSYRIVKLKLEVPEDASSYESYDLEISAEGYDQNRTEHSDSSVFELEVKRDENKMVFEKLYVNDVYCDGEARVRAELENIGEEYEEDVELKIIVDGLGTVFRDEFDLATIDEEDETHIYSLSKSIDLEGLSPGGHSLTVRAEYDDGREVVEKSVNFRVEECENEEREEGYLDNEKRVDVLTERYSNPKRELSWLFGGKEEIVVEIPPSGALVVKWPVGAKVEESNFSIFVLVVGCLAVLGAIMFLVKNYFRPD